jgi:uncharacterized lipoprotein YmbA
MKMGMFALPGLLVLLGCSSGPAPGIHVLGQPAAAVASVISETGRPVLELKPVSLPDYLNSTDILLRDGQNELKVSSTGRWGERLSLGVTRALAEALARRLPRVTVLQSASDGASVATDIDAFDIEPDGRCVLTARWAITGQDRKALGGGKRATIVTMVPRDKDGVSDTGIVTAMNAAVEQLANYIASDVSRGIGGSR